MFHTIDSSQKQYLIGCPGMNSQKEDKNNQQVIELRRLKKLLTIIRVQNSLSAPDKDLILT